MRNGEKLTKNFPVFDCDAHINDPIDIWEKYVEPRHRDLVRQSYWNAPNMAILNGKMQVTGGHTSGVGSYNAICIAGPGMNKRLMRKLQQMKVTPEQRDYLYHKGALDGKARLIDMDLMGIDQVLVIPTMLCEHMFRVESIEGAKALAQAYNNFARDWCSVAPDRLYPAGILPLQNTAYAVQEVQRIASMKFPVGLVRPIEGAAGYPNRVTPALGAGFGSSVDPIFRAFEETSLVLGMHTFPAPAGGIGLGPTAYSPGELLTKGGVNSQTFSFIFEAMTWLAQVLLSGFLDRYPRLKMAIFESNATWLPELIERCDALYNLYKNERVAPAKRLPSQAFYDQCMIAFEADETPVFRQWDKFENVGLWSSDAYHHDGAAAWEAIREMDEVEVPEEVQAKMLGANARRFYGIEGKLYVKEELPITRPDWFPKQDEEFQKWWEREAYPRKFAAVAAGSRPGGSTGAY
jgi:predicted TIM-barrel fold metal-dependent hydrolase